MLGAEHVRLGCRKSDAKEPTQDRGRGVRAPGDRGLDGALVLAQRELPQTAPGHVRKRGGDHRDPESRLDEREGGACRVGLAHALVVAAVRPPGLEQLSV